MGSIFDSVGSAFKGSLDPMSAKKPETAATPDYKGAALATANANKYDEATPYGTVGWALRPGADPRNPQVGDYTRTTALSAPQQSLYDQGVANQLRVGLAGQRAVGDLGNTQSTADALYGKATRYYDQQFGDSQNALTTQLQNQGLAPGSEAYDKAMRNFTQGKNDAYGAAAENAVVGADQAQNNLVSRIASLLASSRGQIPTSSNVAAGPDLLSAAGQQGQADISTANAHNAANQQTMGTIGSLAAAAMMAFSDRRLKSNIKLLGKSAKTDLNIYDYEIFGRRERGFMAQEVQARFPAAVTLHSSGYYMVDYAQLGGRP